MNLATLLFVLPACRGDLEPPPATLAPLEDNRASPPAAVGGELYPEAMSTVSGKEDRYYWAHGMAYIHAPTAPVWEAALDPDVAVHRSRVDEWTVTQDDPGGLDAVYIVHNVVHEVFTVKFDIRWLHEVQQGTPEAPSRVVALWEKTSGTPFIALFEGSIVLHPVSSDVTLLEVIAHEDAATVTDEDMVVYLHYLHESLAAAARGRPLP